MEDNENMEEGTQGRRRRFATVTIEGGTREKAEILREAALRLFGANWSHAARCLGVTPNNVRRWFTPGKCKVLPKDIAYVLLRLDNERGGEGGAVAPPPPRGGRPSKPLTDQDRRVLKAWHSLTDSGRAAAASVLKALLEAQGAGQ